MGQDFKIQLRNKSPAQMREAFERLRQIRGTSVQEELRRRGRIMSVDCMKHTPPFSMGGGKSILTQSWATQKRAGLKAVDRDVRKVFATIDTLKIATSQQPKLVKMQKWLRKYVQQGDPQKVSTILRDFGVRAPIVNEVDPAVHKRARNRRGGVSSSKAKTIVLKKGSIDKYVKKVQGRVGYTKAGWMAGVRGMGGSSIPPSWVTRHSTPGSCVDKTDPGQGLQSIRVENRVAWRGGMADLRLVEKVAQINGRKMDTEAKAILRGKLKAAMRKTGLGR